jgi:flagellar hook-associated protein 3 FlgL
MRISTAQLYQQGLDAMQRQQVQLARTQQQVASGERLLAPADDPAAAKRILDLNQSLALQDVYRNNADSATSRLSLEDTALESVTNLLQRVRELAVQGNNDTLTQSDRKALALEVNERLGELLGVANVQDGAGEYLFAGTSTQTRPFAQNGSTFAYAGDQGQRHVQIGRGYQVAVGDSGSHVFMAMRNGNGTFVVQDNPANTGSGIVDAGSVTDPAAWVPDNYSVVIVAGNNYEVRDGSAAVIASGAYVSGSTIALPGGEITIEGQPAVGDSFAIDPSASQSVFATVQNLANALNTAGTDDVAGAKRHNDMNRFLADIDQAADRINGVRAGVGARLNAVENERNLNEDLKLQLTESVSQLRDVDLAEAITRLNQQLTTLQAAQQSFVQVQNLSLFNFL